MPYYFILFSFLLGFLPGALTGQTRPVHSYPQSCFRKPLDLPVSLNANFGDFRENHFHSGLDFSTMGRTGFSVFAAAPGYVSRIKVQAGGYGQALYLTHANGLVTVYAHLDSYAGAIGEYLLHQQYLHKTYELDIHLQPTELPVKNNELIAISGNSGYSGGPHLHFEIRDSLTEEIINPLLFNFPVKDRIAPVISGIYLYRLYAWEGLTRLVPLHYYAAFPSGQGMYHLGTPIIKESGSLVFGIITSDQQDASLHRHGIYSISLYRNGLELFKSAMTRFGFDQTRAVNSYLDFSILRQKGIHVQRSYVEPGNSIALYEKVPDQALHPFYADSFYKMEYKVADAGGNEATLDFSISSGKDESLNAESVSIMKALKNEFMNPAGGSFPLIPYNRDTVVYYNNKGVSCPASQGLCMLSFPAGSLFDNQIVPVKYSALSNDQVRYNVGQADMAVKDSVLLGIRPPVGKDLKAGNWVLTGNNHSSTLAFVENGFLKAWINYFGTYQLRQDSLPPVIFPIKQAAGLKYVNRIAFMIHDDLSGIGNYRGEIDGVWELFRYDAKTHLLWHTFTDNQSKGNHTLRLVVSDKAGNSKQLILNF